MTAVELGRKIRSHEVSVKDVATEALVAAENDTFNSFITIYDREVVIERAREVQARIDGGELDDEPLAGVPIAVKDNICTKGVRTTCGSKMLEQFVPAYSATAVERLESAGLIVIGKTNMDEFGMGSTTETSFFGPVKNPSDESRVAGGSSGGSAAAVAAGIVPLALGSDTGGSVRQPASHCGVTGLKPTYGTVSRFGLVAYASSMEGIGPIAADASDCAALMDVIAGHDAKDATGLNRQYNKLTADSSTGVENIKIGIPRYVFEGASGVSSNCSTDIGVLECLRETAKSLEKAGAQICDIDIDLNEYVVPAYYIIACAEASSNLSRFDGVKYGYRAGDYNDLRQMYEKTLTEGFGEEVRRRIELGNYVLAEGFYDDYYNKACKVRRLIKEAYDRAFDEVDLILTPTAPTPAPKFGQSLSDPLGMYQSDLYTVPANLCGFPAISFPCGKSEGMPVGAQFMGRPFEEGVLIRAVSSYECNK